MERHLLWYILEYPVWNFD